MSTPHATKKVPSYRICPDELASNILYPIIARPDPASIMGPRILNLSEYKVVASTSRNDTKLGGTVRSCVFSAVYPRDLIMVGRKSEKL